MNFIVQSELCRGCGICEAVCPGVFKMDQKRIAAVAVNQVSKDQVDFALQGENVCPVDAIIHE